jgi:hypothetical protein
MHTETVPPATTPRPWSPARRGRGALAGLLACGAALGVAELLAGVVGAQASPVVAVGGAAIDATPEWLKAFAIRAFGERDKLVLLAGIAAVLAGFAVAVGLAAVRRLPTGLAGIVLLGAVGAAAALSRPAAGPLAALPSLVGALAGAAALTALVRASLPRAPLGPATRPQAPSSDAVPGSDPWWGNLPHGNVERAALSTGVLSTGAGWTGGGSWSPGWWWPGERWSPGSGDGCWGGGRT